MLFHSVPLLLDTSALLPLGFWKRVYLTLPLTSSRSRRGTYSPPARKQTSRYPIARRSARRRDQEYRTNCCYLWFRMDQAATSVSPYGTEPIAH
ncbi:hypothetical protein AX774_g681 [Zancudomyces culisetae]|uniref:Uncharacterized protein n=1 Tax=Zancudomyces culisetae TaxID=1213189 RepID=A0A1R1PXX0_ZANCU|nr:hypothetical protein AX774_g681 [Zancudomyces culisetae]|eukprot:OMH85768.1 hypothetical protein AX774_g681 [Zancudomyces culisetae]